MVIGDKIFDNLKIVCNGKCLAEISDKNVMLSEGLEVIAKPSDKLAQEGEFLYYIEEPDILYEVVNADEKFFTMYKIEIENENCVINSRLARRYPNRPDVATLEDYGLASLSAKMPFSDNKDDVLGALNDDKKDVSS